MTSALLRSMGSLIRRNPWLLCTIVIAGGLCLVGLWQLIAEHSALSSWQWQRQSIGSGQWWRLLTGHMVHLNITHGLMNIAAATLIMALVGGAARVMGWLLVWVVISLTISVLLLYRDTSLGFYAGASGVLHGLVAFGALRQWQRRRLESSILLGGLFAKMLWEQWTGDAAGTAQLIGVPVIVNAHLYGAVAGTVIAAVFTLNDRRERVHDKS